MKRIILQEPIQFTLIETTPDLSLPDGYALVRVKSVDICGTYLHAYRGKQPFFTYPRVLGHELGVEITDIYGNKLKLKEGDKCAVEPYLTCGRCVACKKGKTNCCIQMQVLGVHIDGGMQEYLQIPIHKLHSSGQLCYDQLALVETLAIGVHAVERAQVSNQDTILVIGAGPIGLAVTQFAKLMTDKVLVMDKDKSRLQFCQQEMQVEHTIEADANSITNLQSVMAGNLPTIVFDATGNEQSMHESFQYVSHGGKLVFVGLFQGNVSFYDPEFHKRE